MSKSVIKVGSVSLPLYKHPEGWRFAYKDQNGRWKYVTRRDKKEATTLAREKAKDLSNSKAEMLGGLTPNELSLLSRIRELGFSHANLDEWEASNSRKKVSLSLAIDEFLEIKLTSGGKSKKNYATLRKGLSSLRKLHGAKNMCDMTVNDLGAWLATLKSVSKRRIFNLRAMSITLFRWARNRGYVEPDKQTEAEKLDTVIVARKTPITLSSAEIRKLLSACQDKAPEYLPWLVLTAFAGLRHEELIPSSESGKPALEWSDFNWERKIIIVRDETSKTYRRIIPITSQLEAWLKSLAKQHGRVCPKRPPHNKPNKRTPSITAQISVGIGGWKVNAPRKSFISYRAALVGLAQTAMEAGNSESEAKKSYNDAKGRDEAEEWFSILPSPSDRKISEVSL